MDRNLPFVTELISVWFIHVAEMNNYEFQDFQVTICISLSAFQETGQKGKMHLLVQVQLQDDIEQSMLDDQVILFLQQFDHSGYGGLHGHFWAAIFLQQKTHDYD